MGTGEMGSPANFGQRLPVETWNLAVSGIIMFYPRRHGVYACLHEMRIYATLLYSTRRRSKRVTYISCPVTTRANVTATPTRRKRPSSWRASLQFCKSCRWVLSTNQTESKLARSRASANPLRRGRRAGVPDLCPKAGFFFASGSMGPQPRSRGGEVQSAYGTSWYAVSGRTAVGRESL